MFSFSIKLILQYWLRYWFVKGKCHIIKVHAIFNAFGWSLEKTATAKWHLIRKKKSFFKHASYLMGQNVKNQISFTQRKNHHHLFTNRIHESWLRDKVLEKDMIARIRKLLVKLLHDATVVSKSPNWEQYPSLHTLCNCYSSSTPISRSGTLESHSFHSLRILCWVISSDVFHWMEDQIQMCCQPNICLHPYYALALASGKSS